ncbi:MAG: DUF1049 domain-containing protein [Novosphingobium sp. SCN 66-18]|nr:MAG: DUF1049 domain-containing protein [Novosphingobium sp. SCN 66-18]
MRIVRTIFWTAVIVVLGLFSVANWQPVEVRIWEGLVLETRLPALVISAFLLGLLPMWALYRATRWRLGRRITNLESLLAAQNPAPPLATSTQLEAASTPDSSRA